MQAVIAETQTPSTEPLGRYFSGVESYNKWAMDIDAPTPIVYWKPDSEELFDPTITFTTEHERALSAEIAGLFFNNPLINTVAQAVSKTVTTDKRLYIHGSLRDRLASKSGIPIKPLRGKSLYTQGFSIAEEALNDIDGLFCGTQEEFTLLLAELKSTLETSGDYLVESTTGSSQSETAYVIPQIRIYKRNANSSGATQGDEVFSISRTLSDETNPPEVQLRDQANTFFYINQGSFIALDHAKQQASLTHPKYDIPYPFTKLTVNTDSTQYLAIIEMTDAVIADLQILEHNEYFYLALQQAFRIFQHIADGQDADYQLLGRLLGPLYSLIKDPERYLLPSDEHHKASSLSEQFFAKASKKAALNIANPHKTQSADTYGTTLTYPIALPIMQLLFPEMESLLGFSNLPPINEHQMSVHDAFLPADLDKDSREYKERLKQYNRFIVFNEITSILEYTHGTKGFKSINQYLAAIIFSCNLADSISLPTSDQPSRKSATELLKSNRWKAHGEVVGSTWENTPITTEMIPKLSCELNVDQVEAIILQATTIIQRDYTVGVSYLHVLRNNFASDTQYGRNPGEIGPNTLDFIRKTTAISDIIALLVKE